MSISDLPNQSIHRTPDGAEDLWVMGGLYSYKITPSESGAYLACELQGPEGFAIPVHFHDHEEEAFYVARGAVTMVLEGVEYRLEAGGVAFAPRGIPHSFRFESADAALLLLVSPGDKHVEMLRAMGEPAPRHALPDSPGNLDPAALGEIAGRLGTHIVGPPPLR